MPTNHTTLSINYKDWYNYQDLLARAITPLTTEQLALHAAPHLRSIGVIIAHIIAARVWWFHNIMGEGSSDLAPMVTWDDDDAPTRSTAELVKGLEDTWQLIQESLTLHTPADLDQTFQRRGESFTRQWIIWHIIEHDIHHGGEISLTLGMHDLTAPDL